MRKTCCADGTTRRRLFSAVRTAPGPRTVAGDTCTRRWRGWPARLREAGVGVGRPRRRLYSERAGEPSSAMLAAVSLGAIWLSCSPDFGVLGVLDRFSQIQPKVLITTDGYRYAGKAIDITAKVRDTLRGGAFPRVGLVIVVPFLDPRQTPASSGMACSEGTQAGAGNCRNARVRPAALRSPPLRALLVRHHREAEGDHARARGDSAAAIKEHRSTPTVGRRPHSYFTTCGWMMWNWLVRRARL